jgi:hypothetical protein
VRAVLTGCGDAVSTTTELKLCQLWLQCIAAHIPCSDLFSFSTDATLQDFLSVQAYNKCHLEFARHMLDYLKVMALTMSVSPWLHLSVK